jgi:membrane associated rhomboid family serine protease
VVPSIDDLRKVISSAPMSVALIAMNVAIFVVVTIDSRLLDVLALAPDWSGLRVRPWTALTVFFTAEALGHLAVGVLVLGIIGVRFERIAGAVHVLGVYLLAGLAGSLALVATAAATGFDEPSVGASAAFLGLVGALAVCPRAIWGRLAVDKILLIVFVIQLAAPVVGIGDWVSSAAHLAGLAVGAVYGYLLQHAPTSQRRPADVSG